MNIVEYLIKLQLKGWYIIPHFLLTVIGLEIPPEVVFPEKWGGVRFVHRATGTVLHPKTQLGRKVHIYQGVTIGKQRPWDGSVYEGGCVVKDNAILCAGAKILFGEETLIIGEGTVIGANSVLTKSTGDYEIWAGVPAKKIGIRKK